MKGLSNYLIQQFHFTDKGTEAQIGKVICPRSYRYQVVKKGLKSGSPVSTSKAFFIPSSETKGNQFSIDTQYRYSKSIN